MYLHLNAAAAGSCARSSLCVCPNLLCGCPPRYCHAAAALKAEPFNWQPAEVASKEPPTLLITCAELGEVDVDATLGKRTTDGYRMGVSQALASSWAPDLQAMLGTGSAVPATAARPKCRCGCSSSSA